ncbi:unnamed protein product [Cyclocybe aegerita]|uniref:Uncharacterized protein n=1 Tax=Cyclocybe aegerita TaxID=1973307 RepID=A0A8S0WZE2_CYCAE|nr:unnamed protein product [Cyclocybe aegerita]
MAKFLNFDLIARVIELCRDDYGLLYHCSLVNWEFNRAASRMLYAHVVISPMFKPVLNLRDTSSIPENSNFPSAILSRNASYVLVLEISGYISPRSPPRNTIAQTIASSLLLFTSLQTVILTPATYHEELFSPSIPLLIARNTIPEEQGDGGPSLNLSPLASLVVNASCTDDAHAPDLVKISHLRKIGLVSPGRKILELLPTWLKRLEREPSRGVKELHLKANCGSVTPGVLKAILPHIQNSVQALTLGLSYSLTNDDVFGFISQLHHLRHLELRYYWQLKQPAHPPSLPQLRTFVVSFMHTNTVPETQALDKWIRRAIELSPLLEELKLVSDSDGDNSTPNDDGAQVAHDSLIDHLVKKHSIRLRVLTMTTSFVNGKALRVLFDRCGGLEEISTRVNKTVFTILRESKMAVPHLRSASFQICNVKRGFQVDPAVVEETMRNGPLALRNLRINGCSWQGSWKVYPDTLASEFMVARAEDKVPPWGRRQKE